MSMEGSMEGQCLEVLRARCQGSRTIIAGRNRAVVPVLDTVDDLRKAETMAQRLCPAIVGREPELRALRQDLDSAISGDGRCVLLVGEPGIGKSRLAREVGSWAGDQGLRVVTGRAVPTSGPAPFRPISEALSQLLRRTGLPDDATLDCWLPLLQPVLPALIDRPEAAETPASFRGEAVLQLLRRVAPAGLAVLLEDLHWADPDTVAMVEYLADNLAGTALLLVMTLRDSPASAALEVARRQRARPGVTYLDLGRLDGEQSAAMVRACLPDAAPDVVARVQETSEGVPLLVEDLLASPGLPADFAATVKARLDALSAEHRGVIEAAAVLGRQFAWELLPAITRQSEEVVADGLAAGIESQLLSSQGTELRFRHALTRDAVLDTLLPRRHRQLAESALAALPLTAGDLESERRELVIDVSLRAGQRARAGALLADSGRQSLASGALATAAAALRRAADLLTGSPPQGVAELDLIEALALAGRVEEAAAAGARLVGRLGEDPGGLRVEAHLRLAHAAVAASRWQMARHHLDEARRISAAEPTPVTGARIAVLDADVAMAADDYETACTLVEHVLLAEGVSPSARCHAFEIRGRSHRLVDLPSARAAFENALVTAEAAGLPLWRLRALHELGTIDLLDHAGVDRLLQARHAAEQMGAMSTAASLDLQLAAAFHCRWDLAASDAHASSAIAIAEPLGLGQVRAKALAVLACSASMRGDSDSTERYATAAVSAAPDDRMLDGLCWGARGMALLLAGDEGAAIEPWARGMAVLSTLPHGEPAALRALWPLLLAAAGDRRAQSAIDEARRLGVAAFNLNRSMVGYAEAILAGRRGEVWRARELAAQADTGWANCDGWADLARLLAAPAAAADGWADVRRWLDGTVERFAERGLGAVSRRSRNLLAARAPNPWSEAGISDREADVLHLVGQGLPNKEIAALLHLSPRTVEKHVESLLRKFDVRSRTALAARVVPIDDVGSKPRQAGGTT